MILKTRKAHTPLLIRNEALFTSCRRQSEAKPTTATAAISEGSVVETAALCLGFAKPAYGVLAGHPCVPAASGVVFQVVEPDAPDISMHQ
jgi:hypothetical protein